MTAPTGRSVLVVDDDKDTADSTATILELSGHRAAVAYTAADAIRKASAEPFDVIVLGETRPLTRDGAVARAILEQPRRRRPYLVAMSGFSSDEVRARYSADGADLFFAKPVDPAELLRVVDRVPAAVANE